MASAPATPVTWHDSPSAEQRAALAVVLDLIVPASADGRMPRASQAGPLPHDLRFGQGQGPGAGAGVQQMLDGLERESSSCFGGGFAALDETRRQALFDDWRVREPQTVQRLALEVLTWYYQQDRVLEALGLEARPPFPKGNTVESGDLSLLQSVIDRGRIHRDAP